jgi:hypothetical protein
MPCANTGRPPAHRRHAGQHRRRRTLAADLPRWRWWCCSSPSGPTAAPTRRPGCCAAGYRYAGELRATGDVLVDMLPLLRRTGFDAAQLRADQNRARAASARWASSAATTRATRIEPSPHVQAACPRGRNGWPARTRKGFDAASRMPLALLREAAERPPGRIVQATSLGVEGMVITDLIARHNCRWRWPRWTPARCTPRRWR